MSAQAPTADVPAPVPLTTVAPDGKPHKFEARDGQFFVDGQPTLLIAGEMHFGRVQPEDWDTRIKQAKAMGLNAISFYLFWNQVEKKEGQYDFTGMNDVRTVLQLCEKNGMWAILRPGPYCCAEVEYGGIPWWTAKYPDVKIRTNDPKYVEWSRKYIEQVYKQVGDLQVSKGGPLVMVQIENEYYNARPANNDYMDSLHKIFKDVGFDCQLFTCDPFPERQGGVMDGVLVGQNGLKGAASQALLDDLGDYPVYVPEVYTGWFTGWGQPIATRNSTTQSIVSWVNGLLDNGNSFCLYVFFGGTSYGFYTGCNEYLPFENSYDYTAPIDEAGRTTEKYRALRTLLAARENRKLPEPPPEPSLIELPPIKFTEQEPLLATLPATPTKTADHTVSMEDLDQAYGFVDYRKEFPNGLKGTLELKQAQDYAVVMVNGKIVGEAFRGLGPDSNKVAVDQSGPATLDILVHNLGRISVITNAASQDRARKGLLGGAALDGQDLTSWEMYSLPYESGPDNFKAAAAPATGPAFFHATFTVDKLGGCYLDLSNWSFGAVWVNGHNLGRFWDRGAQRSLWLPQQWLKQGQNDIVVLDLHGAPKDPEISGVKNMVTAAPVPFPVTGLDRPTFAGGARGARGARGGFGSGGFGSGRRGAPAPAQASGTN